MMRRLQIGGREFRCVHPDSLVSVLIGGYRLDDLRQINFLAAKRRASSRLGERPYC
jgi:hypothetical protein